ncbi:diguanylate cyclase [candidate division CSSED10-310 bacterium]|uniref:Diguanylate cyclase n=1 Tax=candidate division CSSED10-310 bacterium TaxID=2855610 RepID=A0ABV6YXW1_UNCC1
MKRVLFIGTQSHTAKISQYLNNYQLKVCNHGLNKQTIDQIRNTSYPVVIFEVSNPSKITKFSEIHQLNPFIPKIILIPTVLRPLKVWQTVAGDYYDLILFPEHLDRLPHAVNQAFQWFHKILKVKTLKDHILTKLDELSVIIEAGRTITSTLNLDEVVNSIMDMITNLIKAEAWSLLLVDEKTNELYFKAARGSKGKNLHEFRLKFGQGIAGWVAKEKKALLVNNVQSDPRFYKEIDLQTKFTTRSILCAPVIFKGRVFAVIEIINRLDKQPFDKKDLSIISFLLDGAAIAIENARLYNKAEELAVTDDLTSLYNARYLNQVLETELLRSKRYKSEVSFIFMDLDYFKQVNDNYGHMVGREVLKEVAALMKKHFRETDLLARYGGDEFVIVLPETGTTETFKLAEKMRTKLGEHIFLTKLRLKIKLTASFGIATYPIHAQTKEELILMADKAMFHAKGNCRNMVYITTKENVCEILD